MSLRWTAVTPAEIRDACLDFAWLTRQRRHPVPTGPLHEPIFIRLRGEPEAARAALLTAVSDPADPLVMEPHELAVLTARCADPATDAGLPDEYALYRELGTPDPDAAGFYQVLDTGFPVALTEAPAMAAAPAPVAAPAASGQPIVALIDDGIAFLNARFRKEGATRFHAVWLQALEQAGSPGTARSGEVLGRAQIDALLDGLVDEASVYAEINSRLIRREAHRSTEHAASHGTHMLDLAAGADPFDAGDPVRDWPLLAVQLPPQAIADTSGILMESYMVMAMRWILRRAAEIDPTAPVLVNLSMGIAAGPKDGTRFAEYQIAREARLWEEVKEQPVRVIWSFGNGFEDRLTARLRFAAGAETEQQIDWIVQPGDQTESYLELRPGPGQTLDGLEIALVPPGGPASGFVPMRPGTCRDLLEGCAPVARISHVARRRLGGGVIQPAHLVVALAPTDCADPEPLAPAGRWQVICRHSGAAPLDLHLQIQRDDSLTGYRPRARQSYFDSPEGYDWHPDRQDHSALAPDCAIRHDGTLNALASASGRQIVTAGAARHDPVRGTLWPAPYSAAGADWCLPMPTVAALVDRGPGLTGLAGTGTTSGSSRAFNGTSAAAARITRALGLSADRIRRNRLVPGSTQLSDFSADLGFWSVPHDQSARLGVWVVSPWAPGHAPEEQPGY